MSTNSDPIDNREGGSAVHDVQRVGTGVRGRTRMSQRRASATIVPPRRRVSPSSPEREPVIVAREHQPGT